MDQQRPIVEVTPQALETAILVWLKVMPPHLWRPYQKMLEIDRLRRKPEDRVDPRDTLASYIAAKFVQAGWTARYKVPLHPSGSGTPSGE